ncbi:hypothetical protein AAC387_Pa03g2154 [Persea americana]
MGRNFFNLRKKNKPSKTRSKSSSSSSDPSVSSSSSPRSPLPSSSSSHAFRIQDSNDLRLVFNKYDANGDGKISSSELGSMLKCLGHLGSTEEVEAMMSAADLDGDGFISLEEFMSVNTTETDSNKCLEDLRNAFTLYDRDKNGLISAEELHHVLRSMGDKASLADCKSMIKGIDRNGDGAVNFEEFVQMMTRSPA